MRIMRMITEWFGAYSDEKSVVLTLVDRLNQRILMIVFTLFAGKFPPKSMKLIKAVKHFWNPSIVSTRNFRVF